MLPFPPPRRDGKLSLAALYRTAGLSLLRNPNGRAKRSDLSVEVQWIRARE